MKTLTICGFRMKPNRSNIILLADDDEGDRLLMQGALEDSNLTNQMDCVSDGIELMDYLNRSGRYAYLENLPLPGLIILDLNMPKKSGHEVLHELKTSPEFRRIPVVIMTTSEDTDDISKTYKLGANSFITKPDHFESLVDTLETLGRYWFQIAESSTEIKA